MDIAHVNAALFEQAAHLVAWNKLALRCHGNPPPGAPTDGEAVAVHMSPALDRSVTVGFAAAVKIDNLPYVNGDCKVLCDVRFGKRQSEVVILLNAKAQIFA
jgi:hypothetical protein